MEQGDVATVRGPDGSTATGRRGPDARARGAARHEPARGCARWRSTTWRSTRRASSARWQRSTARRRSPLHRPRRGARQPRQPAPRRRARRTATSAAWFADSDVYKTLEAVGWELGRAGDAGWTTSSTRPRGCSRTPRRTTATSTPATRASSRTAAARVRLEPRDVLRRAPVAGRRRRRARAPAATTCWRSRAGFADLARRRFGAVGGEPASTATPRSRRRSSSSTASPARAPTWSSPRASSSCAAAACSATDRFGSNYFQDHAPVREATEPTGHAVRQLYLAAGVTDVYLEAGDDIAAGGDGGAVGEPGHREDLRHRRPRLAPPRRGVRRPLRAAARPRLRRDLRRDRELPVELADAAGHGPRALRRRDGAGALQRDRRRRPRSTATASSTPTRCSCAPGTTARRGRAVGAPGVVPLRRAARRTSRAWSPRCTPTSPRSDDGGVQLHLLTRRAR